MSQQAMIGIRKLIMSRPNNLMSRNLRDKARIYGDCRQKSTSSTTSVGRPARLSMSTELAGFRAKIPESATNSSVSVPIFQTATFDCSEQR